MSKVKQQKKNKERHPRLKPLSFDEWLYLIHHLHHYKTKNGKVVHEIHHCFLFSKKNEEGEKFKVNHLLYKNKLYHILEEDFSGILFDHANNSYKIFFQKIGGINYPLIKLNRKAKIIYE